MTPLEAMKQAIWKWKTMLAAAPKPREVEFRFNGEHT